jgi:hypothetical protein
MPHISLPTRIGNISERNFWASLRGDGPVAEARRLGRKGDMAAAYAVLGEHHRRRLAVELAARAEKITTIVPNRGQTAEDLLRHRIVTWHTTVVDFGPEIDWNFRNTDMYGFHYLGWLEAGTRRLLEAPDDAAIRQCLLDIVTSYYRARNSLDHPYPGLHLVYYELGAWAKTEVLLPLYLALLAGGDLPTEAAEAFLKLFLGFGRSLYDLQTGYHGGNWQIVGCSGLLTLARVFPEFVEAPAWEERALQYLRRHLADDFYADGGHKERCWGYGFMSLRGITDAYHVGRRHGGLGKDETAFRTGIRKAFRWFAATLTPTEHAPAYGDDALHRAGHVLDAAAAYFPAGTDRFLGVDRGASCLLAPSGYAIFRNGADAVYANCSFGPFAGWHSHMDTLNLNLWAYGRPLLEEMGRFGGYGEGLSLLMRAPESHNVLAIDGMHFDCVDRTEGGTVTVSGSTWKGHPDFTVRAGCEPRWVSTPAADLFTAWHGAYRANWREPQTVDIRVRRSVVFVKDPGYLLVSDVAREERSNNEGPNFAVTQHWHAPAPFTVLGPGRARTAGDDAVLLAFAPEPSLRRLEPGVDYAGEQACTGMDYPERYHLRARRWMPVEYRGATGVTVLLLPFQGDVPDAWIDTLPLDGAPLFQAAAYAVTTPRGRDVIFLNPDRLSGITFQGEPLTARIELRLADGTRVVMG